MYGGLNKGKTARTELIKERPLEQNW